MDKELERVFRMLDEVADDAKSIRVEIDDEYLRAIAIVEALPENQSGADKSWLHSLVDESLTHFAKATRKR